jgi:hypothetical protein
MLQFYHHPPRRARRSHTNACQFFGGNLTLLPLTLAHRAWYDHRMIKTTDRIALIRTITDANDDNYMITRALFINRCRDITARDFDDDPFPTDTTDFDALLALIAPLFADDADAYALDARSHFALDLSLCPLHFIDYAICFDDDTDECRALRLCFPTHDT